MLASWWFLHDEPMLVVDIEFLKTAWEAFFKNISLGSIYVVKEYLLGFSFSLSFFLSFFLGNPGSWLCGRPVSHWVNIPGPPLFWNRVSPSFQVGFELLILLPQFSGVARISNLGYQALIGPHFLGSKRRKHYILFVNFCFSETGFLFLEFTVNQGGLKLTDITSLWVLGLNACTSTARLVYCMSVAPINNKSDDL